MIRRNYHTHSCFCDGTGHPEEFIEQALSLGMDALGFSSHAPVPFPSTWAMKIHKLGRYLLLIRKLKEKYTQKIPLYIGLETDYLPHLTGPSNFSSRYNLDYVIGSVHYAGYSRKTGYWTVDCNPETFERGINLIFKGKIQAAIEQYYCRIRKMVKNDPPDIIGHLDLVKKNNRDEKYFRESAPWYRECVNKTLDVIARSRSILEVNTGGISRGYTDSVYPSRSRATWRDRVPGTANADRSRLGCSTDLE